ncbi:MAG: hypothetical protein J6Y59_04575 [Bacteroidaceae bacterium]|nr:hypothetical protein [Bacteroidaceae bacterium]
MKRVLILFCFLPWLLSTSSQEPVKVMVQKPGTLSAILTQAQQDTCQYLVISGKLNSADIKVLRKMAEADGRGRLKLLNLQDATIVSSEVPYLTIQKAEETILAGTSSQRYEPRRIEFGHDAKASFNDHEYALAESQYRPVSPFVVTTEDAYYVLLGEAYGELDAKVKAQNLTEWKSLKRQKLNGKGHRISKSDDNHYTYNAFTHKKLFCMDMFYRCPNLKTIVLPRKGKIYDGVAVAGDSERRYIKVTKKRAK